MAGPFLLFKEELASTNRLLPQRQIIGVTCWGKTHTEPSAFECQYSTGWSQVMQADVKDPLDTCSVHWCLWRNGMGWQLESPSPPHPPLRGLMHSEHCKTQSWSMVLVKHCEALVAVLCKCDAVYVEIDAFIMSWNDNCDSCLNDVTRISPFLFFTTW